MKKRLDLSKLPRKYRTFGIEIECHSKEHYLQEYRLYKREGLKYWNTYIDKFGLYPFMYSFREIKNQLLINRLKNVSKTK